MLSFTFLTHPKSLPIPTHQDNEGLVILMKKPLKEFSFLVRPLADREGVRGWGCIGHYRKRNEVLNYEGITAVVPKTPPSTMTVLISLFVRNPLGIRIMSEGWRAKRSNSYRCGFGDGYLTQWTIELVQPEDRSSIHDSQSRSFTSLLDQAKRRNLYAIY